jgi:hypothetical protein
MTAKVTVPERLFLVDCNDQKITIKMDYHGSNKQTFFKKIGISELAHEVKKTHSKQATSAVQMTKTAIFPGAIIGLRYGISEHMYGVEMGTTVYALGRVAFDRRENQAVFTLVEGIYSNNADLIEKARPQVLLYQIGIVVLGLVSGYCLVKAVNNLLPGKRDRRTN